MVILSGGPLGGLEVSWSGAVGSYQMIVDPDPEGTSQEYRYLRNTESQALYEPVVSAPGPIPGHTHDGLLAVRSLSYDPVREPFRPGYRFNMVTGTNIFDIEITSAMIGSDYMVQCMGGRFWAPDGAIAGDSIDALVIDKYGAIPAPGGIGISLMEALGMPIDGSAVLELSRKTLDKATIPIGDPQGRGFNPGGNFLIPLGVFIRLIYEATASAYTSPFLIDLNFAA